VISVSDSRVTVKRPARIQNEMDRLEVVGRFLSVCGDLAYEEGNRCAGRMFYNVHRVVYKRWARLQVRYPKW
jgi:hypothetical protein